MRRISLSLLIAFAAVHIACSYMTDFVVVNESEHPIEVSYKYKRAPGEQPFDLYELPAKVQANRLSSKGGNEWQMLSSSRYQLDRENRTVIVRVMPREALRIYKFHEYAGHEDSQEAEGYPIEEISIMGANGGLKFMGQKARTSFSEVSRALYTLTYK